MYLVIRKYYAQRHVLNLAPLQRFKVNISIDWSSKAWNNRLVADDFIQSWQRAGIQFLSSKTGVRKTKTTHYLLCNTIKVKALTVQCFLRLRRSKLVCPPLQESLGHQTIVYPKEGSSSPSLLKVCPHKRRKQNYWDQIGITAQLTPKASIRRCRDKTFMQRIRSFRQSFD